MGWLLFILTFITSTLELTSAQADFRIKGNLAVPTQPAADQVSRAIADNPHIDPGDREVTRAVKPSPPARPHLVSGFGEDVRLSFACRQIVPSRVKVSYGPGADPDMLVSWKGGDTWPHVIGKAITPLGLHLIATGMTLWIER